MNRWKKTSLAVIFTVVTACQAAWAATPAQPFDAWVDDFRQEALDAGISQRTVNDALSGLQPIHRVIKQDRSQPESKDTFQDYMEKRVNTWRINKGREMLKKHREELEEVSEKYGVPPQYIVALWGMETNFGSYTGNENVISALATLAWEGRREDLFKRELISALRILDQGHVKMNDMKGSWAGAMGQNQFMPSSFERYAVDGDGDGRRDIWGTLSDVFASSANYLKQNGWTEGQRWGREVKLPQNFPDGMTASYVKDTVTKPLSEWRRMGVKTADGRPIPVVPGMTGGIITPDGVGGPAFLVYNNTRTIMRWNNSTSFATSVGILADKIALGR